MTDNRAEVAIEVDGDELTPIEPGPGEKRITRRRLIFRRFLRNKTALVGAVIILLLIVIALIGPYLTPVRLRRDRSARLPEAAERAGTRSAPPRAVETCSP